MTKEKKSDKDNSSSDKIDGAHVVFYRHLPIDHVGNQRLAVLLYKRTQDAPIHPGTGAFLEANYANTSRQRMQ